MSAPAPASIPALKVDFLWSNFTVIEICVYILTVIICIFLFLFYIAGMAKMDMKNKSSCYKETKLSTENGIYTVVAKIKNTPAYRVTYNTGSKSSEISCACPSGEEDTRFTSIPYYDLRSTTPYGNRVKYRNNLSCSCEADMTGVAKDPKFSYEGEVGITNFMYDQNNSFFFDHVVYGSNPEFKTPIQ